MPPPSDADPNFKCQRTWHLLGLWTWQPSCLPAPNAQRSSPSGKSPPRSEILRETDCLLEGSGFELSVPRGIRLRVSGYPTVTSVPWPLAVGRDAGHDAGPDDTSKRAASTARRRATAAGEILKWKLEFLDRGSLVGVLRGTPSTQSLRGALSTSSIRYSEVARCLSAFRTYSSRSNS